MSGGMPTPLSRTRTTASSPSRATVMRTRPPVSVYLAALFSRFTTTCSSRPGSPSTHSGSVGSSRENSCRRASRSGRADSAARFMTARRSTRSLREPQLPLGDAADVEQVVHQPDHLLHLPLDDPAGLLDDRVVGPHLPQDAQGVEDGRERVAEFVGQQGHELLLAPVGLGQAVRPLRLGLAAPGSSVRSCITRAKAWTCFVSL